MEVTYRLSASSRPWRGNLLVARILLPAIGSCYERKETIVSAASGPPPRLRLLKAGRRLDRLLSLAVEGKGPKLREETLDLVANCLDIISDVVEQRIALDSPELLAASRRMR